MPIIGACATKDYPTEMEVGWAGVLDPTAASLARPAVQRNSSDLKLTPPKRKVHV